jgi:predicted nucleotidyltransferase component of viral defense system
VLFQLPAKMVFKGGTSLSKCFGNDLIQRFSEDIDITIDYQYLEKSLDLSKNYSRSALKKISERLADALQECVHNTIMPYLQRQFLHDFSQYQFEHQISGKGEVVKIYYPSVLESRVEYIKS